jgi:serine/threonine protein kinase
MTGPLPVESVRQLAAGLASALIEIHRVRLIHRDLKPSNVLLTDDGPRVIDFGIARAAEGGSGNECDTAEATLSEAVKRIRTGSVGYELPQGTLLPVDPCTVTDQAGAAEILGPVREVTLTRLRECEWTATGSAADCPQDDVRRARGRERASRPRGRHRPPEAGRRRLRTRMGPSAVRRERLGRHPDLRQGTPPPNCRSPERSHRHCRVRPPMR